MKKTAQQIQDDIFRKMSAERKIRLTSSFRRNDWFSFLINQHLLDLLQAIGW